YEIRNPKQIRNTNSQTDPVVARSPDRATAPTAGLPGASRRPPVGPGGVVRRPRHNEAYSGVHAITSVVLNFGFGNSAWLRISCFRFRIRNYGAFASCGAVSLAASSLVPSRLRTEARAIFPEASMAIRETRGSLSSITFARAYSTSLLLGSI